MAFCSKCGTELKENETACPNCGEPVTAPKREKIKLQPYSAIAFVFSFLAFLFGFILTTTYFVTKRGIAYTEYVAVVPALVGLVFGIYSMYDENNKNHSAMASRLSIILSIFTLAYAFIGYMVVAAG